MSTPISKEAREAAERYSLDGGDLERHFQDAIDSASHPPALQWTAERPTKPGHYFIRSQGGIYLWLHRPGDDGTAYRAGLEFAGPVTLPSEPQAKET